MAVNPVWRAESFRLYADTGAAGSSALAAINTAANIGAGQKFRLRVAVGETNNADRNNVGAWTLQASVNGATFATVTNATAVRYTASAASEFVDGSTLTQALGGVAGALTYVSAWSEQLENRAATASRTWTDDHTEFEFALELATVTAGQTVTFRMLSPRATAVTFVNVPTVNVVTSGETVSPLVGTLRVTGNIPTVITGAGNAFFARTTADANSWELRDAAGTSDNPVARPSSGVLRFVGQEPGVSDGTGVINGGGEISSPEEVQQVLFWRVLGAVEQTQQLIWQNIQTIAPTAGTLRLVGQQPTLTPGWVKAPLTATLRIEGQTPTIFVEQSWTVMPSVGTFRLVGQVPTVISPWQNYPTVGTVRFVGQQPTVAQTWTASPATGAVRFVGQPSGSVDLGQKAVSPTAGVLRIVGKGNIERTQSLDWSIFTDYVTQTKYIFWQRSAYVYGYQSLAWDINTSVCDIRHRIEQKRIQAAARSRSMTLRATQKQIRVKACANQ